jgi:ferrous iron transport protein B
MPTAVPSSLGSTSSRKTFLVAVAGNPNSGKTTVFNALTGLRHRVGNYPGVTVEKREGQMLGDPSIRLLDMPGTYSLSAHSPDEEIAREALLGHLDDTPPPDVVVIVVDAGNLERNLYLASQIIDLGRPVVLACNMIDLLEQAGHRLNTEELGRGLGVTAVPTIGCDGRGIAELRSAIRQACTTKPSSSGGRRWPLPEPLEREVQSLARIISRHGYAEGPAADGTALLLLSEGQPPSGNHLPGPIRQGLAESLARLANRQEVDPVLDITTARYAWLDGLVEHCLHRASRQASTMTDRIDRICTHRVWGLLVFAVAMAGMFYGIFALAGPLMTVIEHLVGWSQALVTRVLPAGPLRNLLCDGAIAGAGNVVVFFPQICVLSLFIALLEDTGYMARAAFLMDKLMSRVGLHGKSFIPLLSSHACAIPGIIATRTIENPKDRLATILVAPLMSCSARLPIYTVLIAACLPGGATAKAAVLFSMYVLGIVAALTMASIFKKTLLKGPAPAFIMELPPYHRPRLGPVLRVMWDRSKLFLTRAGTIILAMTIILWALMSYPTSGERTAHYRAARAQVHQSNAVDPDAILAAIDRREAADNLQHSFAGRLGHLIEPAVRPLGYDWRIGVGLIASLAAREVFVSTMGEVYSIGDSGGVPVPLRDQILAATWPDGTPIFTLAAAIGLMVFYALSCHCISTIAVVRRETNTWRWPAFMFVYMTAMAYAGAFIAFQVGTALGFGS